MFDNAVTQKVVYLKVVFVYTVITYHFVKNRNHLTSLKLQKKLSKKLVVSLKTYIQVKHPARESSSNYGLFCHYVSAKSGP